MFISKVIKSILAVLVIAAPSYADSAHLRNGLPPTSMDSFVYSAGGQAEEIYGDEGIWDIPPMFGFTQAHRINAGITGTKDKGLTTGHGSYMPDAWGADEFLAPPGEWSQSGSNSGNQHYNNAAATLDAQDVSHPITYQQNGMPLEPGESRPVQTREATQAPEAQGSSNF